MEPLGVLPFRQRVDLVPEPTVRYAVKLAYLTASRANELCSGKAEDGYLRKYMNRKEEIATKRVGATRPMCPTRAQVSYEEYRDEQHGLVEVLHLTLKVLKRKEEAVKEIALPLSGDCDPWVKQLAGIFDKMAPDQALLPYNRRTMAGWLKDFGLTGTDLGIREESRALNPLRHMRLNHLVTHYDFGEFELLMVGGWSPRATLISGSMGEYLRLAWRKYFPKLLVPLPHAAPSP